MDPTTSLTKLSTKSSCSLSNAPIILNLDEHDLDADVYPSRSPTPSLRVANNRRLRRKQHLSIHRLSAPAQSPVAEVVIEIPPPQRPLSMQPPLSATHDTHAPLYHHPTQLYTHSRSNSQPNIRLGHPRRPLYSAIRPNMSRPSSPMKPPRPTSILDDDTHVDDDPLVASAAASSRFSFGFGSFPSQAPSVPHSGSSVSGEMEMRMALATLAREAHEQDSPASFQFKETSKRSSMSWRVKKLGQGLKDLLRGKHQVP